MTAWLLLGARLALAAAFAVAGTAKLLDRRGLREGLRSFGVHPRLVRPAAVLLPPVELLVACLLVPRAGARIGAAAALALLVVFSAALAYALARGRTPDCHCFGRVHSGPAGPKTLARNATLAALAVVVVATGPGATPGVWAYAGGAAVVAILLQAWLVVVLLLRYGRLLRRVDELESREDVPAEPEAPGLPVGTPAPAFELPDLDGEPVTLDALLARGTPLLLLFTATGCGPCTALLPEVGRLQAAHRERLTIALVSHGDAATARAAAEEHGLADVLVSADHDLVESYRSYGTPSAVLVARDGVVMSPLRYGEEGVRELVEVAPTLPRERASRPRAVAAVAAAAGASAVAAAPAQARSSDTPDIDAVKHTLKAARPRLLADAKAIDAAVQRYFKAPQTGKAHAKSALLAALNRQRTGLARLRSDLDSLALLRPDALRGRGLAVVSMRTTEQALVTFEKMLRTRQAGQKRRLSRQITRQLTGAASLEANASAALGCGKKGC